MVSTDRMIMHYRGLSTDMNTEAMPSSPPNGSEFLEMDTGKMWYFDTEGAQWIDPTETPDAPPDAPDVN